MPPRRSSIPPRVYTDQELDRILTMLEDDLARNHMREITSKELFALVFDLKATRALLKEATQHAQKMTEDMLKAEHLSHYAIGRSMDRARPVLEIARRMADGGATIAELKEEVDAWRKEVS